MSEIKELLLKAVERNELSEFLKGEGEYRLAPHQWVQVCVPTDWTVIIPQGIYKVYEENPEVKIDILFECTLGRMIEGDTFSLYVATSVIFNQILREHDNRAPFHINKNKLISLLRAKLKVKENDLKQYFEWSGKAEKEGIWSEVSRINSILKDEVGIAIL